MIVRPISTPSRPASDDDLARRRFLDLDALESVEGEQLRHARLLGLLIRVERQQRDRRRRRATSRARCGRSPRRPRYGEWSIVETSIWNGPSASLGGGGIERGTAHVGDVVALLPLDVNQKADQARITKLYRSMDWIASRSRRLSPARSSRWQASRASRLG